jgi:predicted PurR-regulated permease PerM
VASNVLSSRSAPQSVITAARLVSFAVVCAVLYFGQVVLIPLAVAVLLAFVLSPAVTRLQRVGVPRVASVLLVVALASGIVGGLGWVIAGEVSALAAELPAYRTNIRAKITDVRELLRGGAIAQVQTTIEDIGKDLERSGAAPAATREEPTPVALAPERSLRRDLERFLPLLETATTAGLALLLSIFMLVQREDVRNRIVSLAGQASLVTTTKAFAEAGQRISRYLLMQLIVNAAIGVYVWVGLYFIGVPYSALWGLIAATLRYVPYVGIWIAALFPLTLSSITSPAWSEVLLVLSLFVAIELLVNNVIEPWLYGQSVGLSPIAVIVAVIFWTWIWGAVGLVLATPLTVCLVVVGKYISGLAVFDRLLGEGRALEPHLWLYQRLLARDEREAADVLEEFAEDHSITETCERLLLPALLVLKRDVASGRIDESASAFVADGLAEIVEELPAEEGNTKDAAETPRVPVEQRVLLVGMPPQDKLDEIALQLRRRLLEREPRCELVVLSADQLIGERIAAASEQNPAAVCVPSLPPGDLGPTRAIVKRLRAALPSAPIVVGRFGGTQMPERARRSLADAGASSVVDTLEELRGAMLTVVTTVAALPPPEAAPPPRPIARAAR